MDLRETYEELRSQKGDRWKGLKIVKIKTRTIGQLKDEGWDARRDRIIGNIHLEDSDYTVSIVFEEDKNGGNYRKFAIKSFPAQTSIK